MSNSASTSAADSQTPATVAKTPRAVFWLVVIAILLMASNMRSPIVALGSIAPVVQDALGLSAAHIGWLGAIPMLMFALGALVSPAIGKRYGLENTLIAVVIVLTAGIIMRSTWTTWNGFLPSLINLSFT